MLQAQQFAELAGVTVRTLHHYDRLGLLRARRTGSGYRVYRESDLDRLEQIVALKFVGLPLKRIKTLLDRDNLELAEALPRQRLRNPQYVVDGQSNKLLISPGKFGTFSQRIQGLAGPRSPPV